MRLRMSSTERSGIAAPREFSVWRFFAKLLFLALIASPEALAGNVYWDGGGVGSGWSTAGNWSTNKVPSFSDTAYVNNGGTATVQSAGHYISGLVLGENFGNSGTIEVASSGSLSPMYSAIIGDKGTGTLNILSGLVDGNNAYIGYSNSGSGVVNVNGSGSKWEVASSGGLYVGHLGSGALNVLNGGIVKGGAYS